MCKLDGSDVFISGPSTIQLQSWGHACQRREFAGLDGELVLSLGRRSRTITQRGRLQAQSAASLHEQLAAIEAFADGRVHTLTDNHEQQYPRILVEQFEPSTPVQRGRGFWCDYVITYRQLP